MPEPAPDNVVAFAPRAQRPHKKPARRPTPDVPPGAELEPLIDSWQLALEAANKSPHTIRTYLRSARALTRWLAEHGSPTDAERVRPEHVRAFLVAERDRASAATAKTHHANLGVFWGWLIAEEERSSASPVLKADKPQVHAKASKYLSDDEIRAMLSGCKGPGFDDRRDTAIVRLFNDTGMRVGGMSGALLAGLDLKGRTLRIRLKGGREHLAPFGSRTAQALDRYLRVRKSHTFADSKWLWVSRRSPHFTEDGIREMVERRGEQAGVADVHPHRFRATFAHEHLKAGGSARGAMEVAGWQSEAMLRHYTEELAGERAREEHARLALGDRI
ncbi:tyrosine-type recombinase/integrase [Streptosporangium sp. CA-135522]|uniref:tyrosine-type recombinase/integrase n=1 Tax=Streptosporangium sp. CA-135522 TaxID=3240072 RepID=UPI003D8BE7DF